MTDKMDANSIIVIGYPRSGNTWLSRLLGDALNSPVSRYKGALPIAAEGAGRPGPYTVYQLHLRPNLEPGDELVPNAYTLHVPNYNGERIVFVVRDPRDVAISVWKYWRRGSLDEALWCVALGHDPVRVHGPWQRYVKSWFECGLHFPLVRYEDLHADTAGTLKGLLAVWGLPVDDGHLADVIHRQGFEEKRKQVSEDGESRPHGITVQLRCLWRGKVGQWRQFYRRRHGEVAQAHFWPGLQRLGYEDSPDWWKELPE